MELYFDLLKNLIKVEKPFFVIIKVADADGTSKGHRAFRVETAHIQLTTKIIAHLQ